VVDPDGQWAARALQITWTMIAIEKSLILGCEVPPVRLLGETDEDRRRDERTVRTSFASDTLVRAAQQMWEGDWGCVAVPNEGDGW
jgi:hypothetical protein